jgi:hypothetical protein
VVSVGTKPPLVQLLKHSHKSIASRSPSLSKEHHLTCHKGSPLRHSPSSLDHLDAASTKDLLHIGKGSPCPPHKVSSPLHTKSEGRRRLPMSVTTPPEIIPYYHLNHSIWSLSDTKESSRWVLPGLHPVNHLSTQRGSNVCIKTPTKESPECLTN